MYTDLKESAFVRVKTTYEHAYYIADMSIFASQPSVP